VDHVASVHHRWCDAGWVMLREVLPADAIASARSSALNEFPADGLQALPRSESEALVTTQFSSMLSFPFDNPALSLLCVHQSIIDVATELLKSPPLLYQAQLWAKYGGAISYEQTHHRDYAKNTSILPAPLDRPDFVEMFVYLSDVESDDGPTALVPQTLTRHMPLEPARLSREACPDLYRHEELALGGGGDLLCYAGDTFHRATEVAPQRMRLSLKLAFKRADATWVSYHPGLRVGYEPAWSRFVREAWPTQLQVVGLPPATTTDSRLTDALVQRYSLVAGAPAIPTQAYRPQERAG
jgi:Phytanoyl-CoA dioxygenase (PhyH)